MAGLRPKQSAYPLWHTLALSCSKRDEVHVIYSDLEVIREEKWREGNHEWGFQQMKLEKSSGVHLVWLLLCWGTFLPYPICWEFLSWKGVALCQMLFLIFWDDHMIFSSHSVHVVYHIFLFAYVEPSLHPRDMSSLVIVYESFNILLHSVC